MSTPTKRHTSSSRKRRASHFALTKPAIGTCTNCKKDIKPHHACRHCGFYRGRDISQKTSQPLTAKVAKISKSKKTAAKTTS